MTPSNNSLLPKNDFASPTPNRRLDDIAHPTAPCPLSDLSNELERILKSSSSVITSSPLSRPPSRRSSTPLFFLSQDKSSKPIQNVTRWVISTQQNITPSVNALFTDSLARKILTTSTELKKLKLDSSDLALITSIKNALSLSSEIKCNEIAQILFSYLFSPKRELPIIHELLKERLIDHNQMRDLTSYLYL